MTRTRALTEFGPLGLFFVTNLIFGIMPATGVLIVATLLSVGYAYRQERRVPWIPVIGAVVLTIFGGLTLAFDDAFFLKIKPTVASLLSAFALAIGMVLRKNLLRMAFGGMLQLDERGWRDLTVYWIGLFVVMAVANEIAWRSLSTDGWVTFKAFGLTAIAIVGSIGATPIMRRAQRPDGG